jgi:hypothetical protein
LKSAARESVRGWALPLCCALVFGIGLAGLAWPRAAGAQSKEQRIGFDIPAQPLAKALQAFSAVSGYQILMAQATGGATDANAVKGILLPREALTRMILGTGFAARFTGDQAAIIVRDVHDASTLPLNDSGSYDAVLQSEVIAGLCRDAATRPGPYRAALDLWISESGRVERTELLHTTGNTVRDQLIVTALRALNATPPPRELAQPITLLVLPTTHSTQTCELGLTNERASTR